MRESPVHWPGRRAKEVKAGDNPHLFHYTLHPILMLQATRSFLQSAEILFNRMHPFESTAVTLSRVPDRERLDLQDHAIPNNTFVGIAFFISTFIGGNIDHDFLNA